MTTGTNIISGALYDLGVASVISPPTPQAINEGVTVLNSMLEKWRSKSININTRPLRVAADDLNEPPDVTLAIRYNLALMMSPMFSAGRETVSPSLRRNANVEYQDMCDIYRSIDIPGKVLSSSTPVGAGNDYGGTGRWSGTSWPAGTTVDK